MPLDTGGVTSLDLRNGGDRETNRASGLTPSLEVGPDIGAALKAARELRGLNLQELADSTRIRRSYLAAIEELFARDGEMTLQATKDRVTGRVVMTGFDPATSEVVRYAVSFEGRQNQGLRTKP